jgi:hypothetical protein
MLKTSAASDDQRPAWVGKPPFTWRRSSSVSLPDCYEVINSKVREGDCYVMNVSTGPFATRQECDAEIPGVVQSAINHYVELYLGNKWSGHIGLSAEQIDQLVVTEWPEIKVHDFGPMIQVHLLLNFDKKAKEFISEAINQSLFENRAAIVGTGFGAFCLLLTAFWGYLKIDIHTKGVYRKRLRLAAGFVILSIVVTGFTALRFLA